MEKLVRDKIPEIISQRGEKADYYIADSQVYNHKLLEKLREEADELIASVTKDEMIHELADVREVIESIMTFFEISEEELLEVKTKKKSERGGFEKGYILRME